ncbi:hypothetical protein [Paraburkholderia caballeronis]|uniref:Acid shock protein n=1 Tax=Paraburkholderia caballeronis TaxID=416943 RepID=A0A1H7HR00_9BURK|nr:hypothetical protein [Paraburkholderia caballeronis]PXW29421.1 hypothetical protein C7403_101274 [Paraburkholderia caballeronis]PXX04680.1 hypothetical protein C7407_101274 [Paraburkholderia caballeronis]RAK05741.1 hypothetical protein C7409_101274 [Paraburkholderia caballeronis]TDV18520.1 hypothetical protein C7408_103277 [Paraburkholderia caballeronis]TDV19942.1 hypothetical protein C7406_103164 [Paraburkholderia caballeronis]
MKKLVLMLAATGIAVLAQPSFAQTAAPQESSAATSYSAPTVKHVKKPKAAKTTKKHWWKKKKAASAPDAAAPASQ